MPSSYSSILRLEKQANGENQGTWGTKLNTVIDLIEAAIAGAASISTTGGSTTLSTNNGSSDQARCMALLVTGTLVSNATLVIPNASKLYVIKNGTAGAFTLSVKTSSGSAITIPQSDTVLVYCDGSDVVTRVSAGVISDISDFPSFSGNALKLLRLNSGGTALEFAAAAVQDPEFDSGTGIMFGMSAAPTGYTQDTSISDRMLRVTNGAGDSTGGTWTISGATIGSTTLSTSQIPAHTHTEEGVTATGASADNSTGAVADYDAASNTSGSTGGGTSHNHTASFDGAWRPAYYNVIRATKD